MSDITIRFHDYSHVKVVAQLSILKEIKEYFSFFVEGYQFSPKFIYGDWDGKLKLMDNDGLLPFGLVKTLVKFAKNNLFSISLDQDVEHTVPLTREKFDDWVDSKKYFSGQTEIYPHWYQLDAVFESLVNKRRILNLPTSAGKSLIQALLTKFIIENSDENVLILVPTVGLVSQMKDDFIDYRLFVAEEILEVSAGAKKQTSQRIVISTWQSAIKKPKAWFNQFGMLLCDEMHLAIGKSISAIINKLTNCQFKIGLSGSLRDGKANLMQYVGLFGEIYNPVKTKDLMDSGQISKLKINVLMLKYPRSVSDAVAKVDYATEVKAIAGLKKRNDWVGNLGVKLAKRKENVFIMFRHIEHGKAIYDSIKALGYDNVHYVSGEVSPQKRDELKKLAENDSGVIIIASYGVFSTGISVKNLHHVIFAAGTKSKVIVLQTIGRVLRKHGSKTIATVWDLVDDMSYTVEKENVKTRKNVNYSLKHGIERIERYGQEQFDYVIKNIEFLK